jgi:molecular chaperone GrpE
MTKTSLHDQLQTLDANWKRALADYQNLLRRVEHDKQQFSKMANVNLIARLLPSLDIIELAATHTKDLGVEMAAKQFHTALVEEGLELITPAVGEIFDHNLHECTEAVALVDGQTDNTIAEVLLKGYKISDYILRPARVKVYKKTV